MATIQLNNSKPYSDMDACARMRLLNKWAKLTIRTGLHLQLGLA